MPRHGRAVGLTLTSPLISRPHPLPLLDLASDGAQCHPTSSHDMAMENMISLINKLQACTTLSDNGEERALSTLWVSLPAIAPSPVTNITEVYAMSCSSSTLKARSGCYTAFTTSVFDMGDHTRICAHLTTSGCSTWIGSECCEASQRSELLLRSESR
jgi:hypothetical protein